MYDTDNLEPKPYLVAKVQQVRMQRKWGGMSCYSCGRSLAKAAADNKWKISVLVVGSPRRKYPYCDRTCRLAGVAAIEEIHNGRLRPLQGGEE